ncbi:hypothetical protein HGB07_01650 [Candidatus Roizmanbacteria bacterium]|nr:hypothetical protein [Candidatus Roizmanbacteria bacterium]
MFGFNLVDWFFLALILYYVFLNRGFIETLLEVVIFIIALVSAYALFPSLGAFFGSYYYLSRGWADALGFSIAWFSIESLLHFIGTFFLSKSLVVIRKNKLNQGAGAVMGFFQACFMFLFFVSFIFALPIREPFKQQIVKSRTGPYFLELSQGVQTQIKQVYGGAVTDTLNFLTIHPKTNEVVELGYTLNRQDLHVDSSSEDTMVQMVNNERIKNGLTPLTLNTRLRDVARVYADQMWENGFFSHISKVDQTSVSGRITRQGIDYQIVGENLALAPDVYQAHEGLMNSAGHRKNILTPEYGEIGIGVIDGALKGKIFVQIFKNS